MMGLQIINSTEPLQVNAHRRELRINGDAYDINRIVEAGKKLLDQIEEGHRNPLAVHTLVVHAPTDSEP